jgi:hypothetical protein
MRLKFDAKITQQGEISYIGKNFPDYYINNDKHFVKQAAFSILMMYIILCNVKNNVIPGWYINITHYFNLPALYTVLLALILKFIS